MKSRASKLVRLSQIRSQWFQFFVFTWRNAFEFLKRPVKRIDIVIPDFTRNLHNGQGLFG